MKYTRFFQQLYDYLTDNFLNRTHTYRYSSRFDPYFEPRIRGTIIFSPKPKSTKGFLKQAENMKKLHSHMWGGSNGN